MTFPHMARGSWHAKKKTRCHGQGKEQLALALHIFGSELIKDGITRVVDGLPENQ